MNMLHAFGIFMFLCWNTLAAMSPEDQSAVDLVDRLEKLEKKFSADYQEIVPMFLEFNLDERLKAEILLNQGKVRGRVDYNDLNMLYEIPLGSLHDMILPEGLLFFQDLKLERPTTFYDPTVSSNLLTRDLNISLDLKDLSIVGKYEVAKEDSKRNLICTNNHGDALIELYNTLYKATLKMQIAGNSVIVTDASSVLLSIQQSVKLQSKTVERQELDIQLYDIASVLDQLRSSLDKWLIQYINGLLYPMVDLKAMVNNDALLKRYTKYTQEYDYHLTNFVDDQVRIYVQDAGKYDRQRFAEIHLFTPYDVKLILYNGLVESLSSLYRKHAFLHSDTPEQMSIHAVLAFSRFRIVYNYLAKIPQQEKKMKGNIILNLDDTEMRLLVIINKATQKVSSLFLYTIRTGAYSLTVEGPLNRYYSVVRHLLMHQVLAMLNRSLQIHLSEFVKFGDDQPGTENPLVTEADAANTTYVCEYKVVTKPEIVSTQEN